MSIFNGNSFSNVNVGTAANSGDGDALRTAFVKTNNNFFDIYTFLGNSTHLGNVTNINIKGGTITGITDLAVADGGTGASTATAARTNLGLAIGINVQAWDTALDAVSSITPAADRLVYYTGTTTASGTVLTSYARTLLDDIDAATSRTTLGLGNAALLNDGLFVVKDSNVTANLTTGNLTVLKANIVTANVGNVLLSGGNVTAIDRINAATGSFTGNVTVGNLIITGTTTIAATQNITGNVNVYNLIAANAPEAGGSAIVSVQGRFSGNVTAGNISATRGTFTQVDLPATGVSATTYGGTSKVPVITIGSDGRISSASNVNVAGVSTFTSNNRFFIIQTADGSSFTANIPNVAVTADTYGGTSKVPVITVDAQGRITSAANVNVAGVTSFTSNNRFFIIQTADGSSFTANIPNVAVTANTFGSSRIIPSFDIDAQGRITRAANISMGDIALGTDTSGNYVATAAGGTGISVAGSGSESAVLTITNTGVVYLGNTAPISANASSGTITLSHDASGVSASTYGGSDSIGYFAVNSFGHITSAGNVTLNTAFSSTTVSNITTSNINVQGNALFRTYSEYVSNITSSSTTIDINLADSGVFFCVMNSNKTFTFSSPPTNRLGSFSLITLNSHNGNTITWPGTVYWAGGAANIPPRTSNVNAIDVWTFFTYNSGSSYIGTLASKDAKA